jgi:hypothetical protein
MAKRQTTAASASIDSAHFNPKYLSYFGNDHLQVCFPVAAGREDKKAL